MSCRIGWTSVRLEAGTGLRGLLSTYPIIPVPKCLITQENAGAKTSFWVTVCTSQDEADLLFRVCQYSPGVCAGQEAAQKTLFVQWHRHLELGQ